MLYGANVATYKIALALSLMGFAEPGKTHVTMNELARAFFQAYRQRLGNGLPQQTNPARSCVLERAVEAYQRGERTETAAIEKGERQGFSDVVPRFHTASGDPIPLRLYEATASGLVLTDALLATFQGRPQGALRKEAESRSRLLEAAFAMHLPVEVPGTDEHRLYRTKGYERIDITGTRPVLAWLSERPLLLLRRTAGRRTGSRRSGDSSHLPPSRRDLESGSSSQQV